LISSYNAFMSLNFETNLNYGWL